MFLTPSMIYTKKPDAAIPFFLKNILDRNDSTYQRMTRSSAIKPITTITVSGTTTMITVVLPM